MSLPLASIKQGPEERACFYMPGVVSAMARILLKQASKGTRSRLAAAALGSGSLCSSVLLPLRPPPLPHHPMRFITSYHVTTVVGRLALAACKCLHASTPPVRRLAAFHPPLSCAGAGLLCRSAFWPTVIVERGMERKAR